MKELKIKMEEIKEIIFEEYENYFEKFEQKHGIKINDYYIYNYIDNNVYSSLDNILDTKLEIEMTEEELRKKYKEHIEGVEKEILEGCHDGTIPCTLKKSREIKKEIVFWSKQQGNKYFTNPKELDEFLCNKGIFKDDSTDVYFNKQLEINNIDTEEFNNWEEKNNYSVERDYFIQENGMRDLTDDEYFEAIAEELSNISSNYELKQQNIIPDDIEKLLEEKEEEIEDNVSFSDFKDELLDSEQFKTKEDMIKAIKKATNK